MNVTQEYKQTEFGPIPSDWILCTFQDVLVTFSSGATPYRGIPEYYKGNVRWISSGELNYNKIFDTVEHISQQAVRNTNLRVHQPGTFLMAITGLEAEGTRGRCAFVGAPATTNQSCLAINGTERMCTEYLFWFYRMWGQYLAFKYCQGTKQQSYTANIVRNLPIYGPKDITEQQAIAEALSDIDGLIAALDKKIAKKRLIKQGAMSKLLSLSNRGNKWFNTKLGSVVNIRKGSMLTSEEFIVGNVPVIAGGKTPAGYHNVANRPANTITISASGASAGYVALHNTPIFASDCSTIVPDPSYDIKYIYHLLVYYQSEIYSLQTGGAQPHVHPSDLNEMQILYASDIKTQQAIATILSDMDKEIADFEAKRDKYRLLKSGMMQKLLTGQIRLKINRI